MKGDFHAQRGSSRDISAIQTTGTSVEPAEEIAFGAFDVCKWELTWSRPCDAAAKYFNVGLS